MFLAYFAFRTLEDSCNVALVHVISRTKKRFDEREIRAVGLGKCPVRKKHHGGRGIENSMNHMQHFDTRGCFVRGTHRGDEIQQFTDIDFEAFSSLGHAQPGRLAQRREVGSEQAGHEVVGEHIVQIWFETCSIITSIVTYRFCDHGRGALNVPRWECEHVLKGRSQIKHHDVHEQLNAVLANVQKSIQSRVKQFSHTTSAFRWCGLRKRAQQPLTLVGTRQLVVGQSNEVLDQAAIHVIRMLRARLFLEFLLCHLHPCGLHFVHDITCMLNDTDEQVTVVGLSCQVRLLLHHAEKNDTARKLVQALACFLWRLFAVHKRRHFIVHERLRPVIHFAGDETGIVVHDIVLTTTEQGRLEPRRFDAPLRIEHAMLMCMDHVVQLEQGRSIHLV